VILEMGGPEEGANQDIIHPQREGHDEMLVVEEQHAALDPNRLCREEVLESLCRLGNHWKENRVREGEGMENGSYMMTHLQQPPL